MKFYNASIKINDIIIEYEFGVVVCYDTDGSWDIYVFKKENYSLWSFIMKLTAEDAAVIPLLIINRLSSHVMASAITRPDVRVEEIE